MRYRAASLPGDPYRSRPKMGGVRAAYATLAFLLGLAAAGSAAASSTAEAIPGTIVPGVGVGALKLGMTETAAQRVLRSLGRPRAYGRAKPAGLKGYVEYQYPSFEEAFGAVSYVVGFEGPKGRRRVVMIDVGTARNRTASGVRVSTSAKALRSAYPAVDCRVPPPTGHKLGLLCFLGNVRATHTVFLLKGVESAGPRELDTARRVSRVVIRRPFVPLDLY